MASDSTSDKLLVASIDFGTTYSGWAYSFKNDFNIKPTNGYVKLWHSGSGTLSTEKTPTVILVKPDGKTLEAFGYEAENKYKELIDAEEHTDYYYFRKFKMKLHKQLSEKVDRNFLLEDETGKTLPALEVFTMAIKFLVDDIHSVIQLRINGIIERTDVLWVLTVPAIWTDPAKQFMREAAEKAGIERYNLNIVLEPEAASVYCRHLTIDLTVGKQDISISTLPAGTKYMVLDAGGGTIDITVHEVNEKLGIKEVTSASGGGWGGTLIDEEFENLLRDIVSDEAYQTFKLEEIEDWLEIMRDFEVKKKTVRPEKDGRIMMRFPASLRRISENNGRDVEMFLRESSKYSTKIEFVSDKIKFQANMFKALFTNSCLKTIEHIKTILQDENLENLNVILMVGGYSESPMLQEAVIKSFPNMRVIIPNEASTAILKGALICGHRSEFITERVLKYSYGVHVSVPFIEGHHPESRRLKTDGGDKCNHIFDKHVNKGQIVKVGDVQVHKSYYPSSLSQDKLVIDLYASDMQNPEFVDVGCFKIGSLSVDIEPGNLNYVVDVALTFSGTEIKVEGKSKETGLLTNININFLG